MASKVWFIPVQDGESASSIAAKAQRIFAAADAYSVVSSGDYVAVKMHFGENKNIGYLKPEYIKPILTDLKAKQAKVFLTDTNTLYKGNRFNSVDHLMQAYAHGFTPDNVGVPVIIADGLLSKNVTEVPINGKHCKTVKIANDFLHADAVVVLSHPTGHVAAGLGAAIKNVAMGAASRAGKQIQHADVHPSINREKCVACGTCIRWCPVEAISWVDGKAHIDSDICYGCAECVTNCRFDAVDVNAGGTTVTLQEKMAEYAWGALREKKEAGKMVFANFLVHVTKYCDCLSETQKKAIADIGILVSFDPVAIDQATADLLHHEHGKDFLHEMWPEIDYDVQLRHAEELGLGTREYELIRLDEAEDIGAR